MMADLIVWGALGIATTAGTAAVIYLTRDTGRRARPREPLRHFLRRALQAAQEPRQPRLRITLPRRPRRPDPYDEHTIELFQAMAAEPEISTWRLVVAPQDRGGGCLTFSHTALTGHLAILGRLIRQAEVKATSPWRDSTDTFRKITEGE